MSRNKLKAILACAALAALLPAAAAQDLIAPDQIVADEVKYNTTTAEYGTLARSLNVVGSEYFPLSTTVRYRGDTATYVRTNVRRGDTVKAGDVLAEVEVQFNEVTMAQLELELDRVRREYERAMESFDDEIASIQGSLSAERDEYARSVLFKRLEKVRLQKERAVNSYEYDIYNRQHEIDTLNERHSRNQVFAPIDGVIADVAYLKEGAMIYDGQVIAQIESQDVMFIAYKEGKLRYGMQVSLETGPGKNRVTTKGHVVAASDCLSKVVSDYALVAVDDPAWREINWRNTKVSVDYIHLENVLLVERKAVTMDGGKYIVTRLNEDGVTQKRFVNQGLFTPTQSWVIQGLEPGDILIID